MKFYQNLQTIFMKMDSLGVEIDKLTAYKTVIIITVTMPFLHLLLIFRARLLALRF